MQGETPLKTIREQRGMPRYKVAARLGVTDRTMSYYEAGERFPPLDKAILLANFYGVSLDELAGNDAARKAVAL